MDLRDYTGHFYFYYFDGIARSLYKRKLYKLRFNIKKEKYSMLTY